MKCVLLLGLPTQWTGLVQLLKFISDQKDLAECSPDPKAEEVVKKANILAKYLITSNHVEADGIEGIRWFEQYRQKDKGMHEALCNYCEDDIDMVTTKLVKYFGAYGGKKMFIQLRHCSTPERPIFKFCNLNI